MNPRCKFNPVLLGSGIPLVSRLREVVKLELRSTKVYGNGVLLLQYAVVAGSGMGKTV